MEGLRKVLDILLVVGVDDYVGYILNSFINYCCIVSRKTFVITPDRKSVV